MATPIIVIGMNRSGTKWLSNLICSHQDVIGVQSRRHFGILETNMFGPMQEKFNLSSPDDYVGFLEMWANTEFFRRTGIDKQVFYELNPRPRNFYEIFERLMNEFAEKNGKSYWLQKTAPSLAIGVLEYFQSAKIILIRRNLLDTLRSTWALHKDQSSRKIIRTTFTYVHQRKTLRSIANKYNVAELDFTELKSSTTEEMSRIFLEIGLDPNNASLEQLYKKNTSFDNDSERHTIMSTFDRIVVGIAAAMFWAVPITIMSMLIEGRNRIMRRAPVPFVSDTFGSLTDKLKDKTWDFD